jgi:bifunctional non-homologous end joining protein LigD
MLATLAEAPLSDPNLVYEPKYDGIRALVTVTPGRGKAAAKVEIASRLGNDKTAQFPELVSALARWGRHRRTPALLDGEIVALNPDGEPAGFQRLQDRIHLTSGPDIVRRAAENPIALVVFDFLRDGDDDLCGLPLTERRRRLEAAIKPALGDVIRISAQARGDGASLFRQAQARGWEGLVVKDARSTYRPGQRTREWRKLKLVKRQELIVGGYTEPRGARSRFGALLVGMPAGDGRLRYAGHVGGGFSERELERIWRLLAERRTDTCPFETRPPSNERPYWVRPELIAEVRFSEWTDEGYLRHPVYLGLRDDLEVSAIRREPEVPSVTLSAPPARLPVESIVTGAPGRSTAKLLAKLDELEARGGGRLELTGGVAIELGNLKKPLWPALGLTKADLVRYYVAVSPFLLPVVRDRPLVMRRFPDGIDRPAFYQHRAPDQVPAGVRLAAIEGDDVPSRFVGGDLATLLHMTQLAAISQDPWFSRVQSRAAIDFAAIDLDPMAAAPFSRVRDVARWVRDELENLGVTGAIKTSGASGLHIYLPMRSGTPYEAGMLFCQIIASLVAGRHPEAATVERTVARRDPAAVYVDYLQNIPGKTLACAYSARASAYAGASAPLRWEELDDKLDPRAFTIVTLPARLRQVGDLWAGLRRARGIDLEAALERAKVRHGKGRRRS